VNDAEGGARDEQETVERRVPEDALRGARLGLPSKYHVVRELGVGGMGSVYLARDAALDRPVAIKLLAETYSKDPALVARFQHEARTVAKLNHPCIVQVYEIGLAAGRHFFAMEFIDGETYATLLARRGAFGETETIDVARQACAALAVAHAAGIVHRDVKPDNMMRTSNGGFKLVDLGLAKVVDDDLSKTGTGVAMGTPYYISPEQIRGERDIDLRTDVYSLGATMYQLATGHIPFEGSSAPHVMSRHLRDPLPDPRQWTPSLTEGFCRVLVKMMAKEREDRHRDMNDVHADLRLVAEGGTPAAASAAPRGARAWVREELAPIESALLPSVGPMARLLVAKAAESAATRDELVESLVRHVTNPSHRKSFLDACAKSAGAVSAAPRAPTPAPTSRPAAATTVATFDASLLVKLTALLAERIGPVAGVVVRRSSAKSASVAALVATLAAEVPAGSAREGFVAAARGVAGG